MTASLEHSPVFDDAMQTSTWGEVGEAREGRGQTTEFPEGSTEMGAAVETEEA